MTSTHVSHFGLTLLATTKDNVVLEGTKSACWRMAYAHGMEIDRYEGKTVSYTNGVAVTAPADSSNFVWCYFKNGGFVLKGRDTYTLVLPLSVWNERL